MAYFIHARDGASRITLHRETREAALKRARELEDFGWFEVEVAADAPNGTTPAGEPAKVA